MKTMLSYFEVNCRIHFDVQPMEHATRTYPGCPASIEVNQLIFEDDNGNEIRTLEDLGNYLLKHNTDQIITQAWEEVEEEDPY